MGTKKKMNGFVLFVLSFFFGFLVLSVVMIVVTSTAHAERQLLFENGTLTVWIKTVEVKGFPENIKDAETAFKFYSGQLKEAKIGNESKKKKSLTTKD